MASRNRRNTRFRKSRAPDRRAVSRREPQSFLDPTPRNPHHDIGSSTLTAQEAMERLEGSMRKDVANRYLFACRKALLLIRIVGARVPLRFDAGDQVAFR